MTANGLRIPSLDPHKTQPFLQQKSTFVDQVYFMAVFLPLTQGAGHTVDTVVERKKGEAGGEGGRQEWGKLLPESNPLQLLIWRRR